MSRFQNFNFNSRLHFCSWIVSCLTTLTCFANPTDPLVISGAGTAQFSNPTKHALHIHAKDQAIIHWKDFSIDAHELTKFIQPSKHALVLNKVTGENVSKILGRLEANGHVLLLNSNGILFGSEARIETGGFIATTLDFENHEEGFLFKGDTKGTIINYGTIKAWDGDVTLISRAIENHGTLEAREGHVNLGAGQEILLKREGDERIFIRAKVFEEETGIHNTGFIQAIQTELKADGNPYSYAIKQEGTIDALNLIEKNGRVLLSAEGGVTLVMGTIHAPAGEVRILGEKVGLIDEACIDVSSEKGGGTILVGGSYQGKDPTIYNSQFTTVLSDVTVRANGLEEGNGGTIVFWSDGYTRVHGTIEAQGGSIRGDGGLIEISGLKSFDIQDLVNNTSATNGKLGELLLDPEYKVVISTALSRYVAEGPIFDPSYRGAEVNIKDIQSALSSSNVIINSCGAAGFGDPPGAIIIDANVNHVMPPSATGTLTLNCTGDGGIHWHGQITFSSPSNDVTLICNPEASTPGITFKPTSKANPAILSTPGNIFLGTSSIPCKGDIHVLSQFGQDAGARSTLGNVEIYANGSLLLNGEHGNSFIEGANNLPIHITKSIDISCPSVPSASFIASTGNTGSISIGGLGSSHIDSINIKGDGGVSSIFCLGSGTISIEQVDKAVNILADTANASLSTVNGSIEIKNSQCGLNIKGGKNGAATLHSATGNILVDIEKDVVVSGGTSTQASADSLIRSLSGNINLNSAKGSLTIAGGVDAQGAIISNGKIAITASGKTLLKGGISKAGHDAHAHITSNNHSVSLYTKEGDISLIGGISSHAQAQIHARSTIDLNAAAGFNMESVAAGTLLSSKEAINITATTAGISLFGGPTASSVIEGVGGVSMSANTTLDINHNCTITSHAPITLICGDNFTMQDNGIATTVYGQSIQITSTKGNIKGRNFGKITSTAGAISLSAGKNVAFYDYFQVTQSGRGGLTIAAVGTMPEFTGNIKLYHSSQATSTNDTTLFCAGSSFFLEDTANINTMGTTTILTDNLNPDRIGPGGFRISDKAQINTNGHPLAIYTAKRSQNAIHSEGTTIAKTNFIESPQYINTTQQSWGVFYPEGRAALPFTIFYKETDLITIAPSVQVSQLDFSRIVVNYIGPFTAEMQQMLHPYDEFISHSIRFKTDHQDKEGIIIDEQGNFIRRPTFKHNSSPALLINDDFDTSF